VRALWLVIVSGCLVTEIGPGTLDLAREPEIADAGMRDAEARIADAEVEEAPDAGDLADAGDPADAGELDEQEAKEQAVLQLINAQRAVGATCGGAAFGPSAPLEMDRALQRAARRHSEDMATQDYFDHTSLDGRGPQQRMQDEGYRGLPYGENIAAGSATAEATVQQWLGSPGHCSLMMSGEVSDIGVGYAFGPSSTWGHYWTLTFGL
jgi:uncharacterized protein YkwD